VLRALLEGVALEMRLNLHLLERAGVEIREFRAVGGGARSRALTRLKADVLGRPVTTVEVTEAGCLGAAALACAARTGADVGEVAGSWVRTGPAVEPDPARARRYDGKFAEYLRLYPALREFHRAAGSRPVDRAANLQRTLVEETR
jgi:xylulokinase